MTVAGRCTAALFILLCCQTFLIAADTRQWVARFSGSKKGSENGATAMAIDDSGNVIVTGWASNKTTGIDYGTVKYSSDGELLWARSFDGGHGEDHPVAVAVDTGNNVYVTGWSDGGSGHGFDFLTIKYSPDGSVLWTGRYDGPGHGEDKPVALAVNDSLNVFITGWSAGDGTGADFATIKYRSTGDTAWVQRYDGGKGSTDRPGGMALRGSSDLYVTGLSVDTTNDYTTIKYNAATGAQRWVRTYKGSGDDEARAVALRGSQDVIVTGSSQSAAGDYDFLTIKYDSAGVQQWVRREDGPAHNNDIATAVAVSSSSPSARIYVTGRGVGVGSYNDFMTVRYDLDGTLRWAEFMDGTANDDDGAVALLGGGPLVAGPTSGRGVGFDYGIVEYNQNGDEQKRLIYNSPFNADDVPVAIASSGGGTYIAGRSKRDKGSEFLTIKYVDSKKVKYRSFIQDSLAGVKGTNLKLAGAVPTVANVRDSAFARAFPKLKKGAPGAPGGLVLGNVRRDSAAEYGWIRFEKGNAIAKFMPHTDPARGFDLFDGKPFVGEKKSPKLLKYNNHLVGELIALRINIGASDAEITPPTFGDMLYQGADTVNGILLKGMSLRDIGSLVDNLLTYWKKYPAVNWDLLDTLLSRTNRAFTGPMRTVSTQPLVVTGAVLIDSVQFLKGSAAPLAEPLAFPPSWLEQEVPGSFILAQNYPNPFNPSTTIEFELPAAGLVSLTVYDILGREVGRLLDDQNLDEGHQEVTFEASGLATGVYFYRLRVNHGEFSQVRKMVLMR